jgi:hypothetical protein
VDGFESAGEIRKLCLETEDRDFFVWVFADDESLTRFWLIEIKHRLDSWMEDGVDDWVEMLRADEGDFIEKWGEVYREWWSTSEDTVLRYIDAGKALREIRDGQGQG